MTVSAITDWWRYGLTNTDKHFLINSNKCEQNLGYDKYSIIGYSEGAKVALLMTTQNPDSIDSIVLSAFSSQTSNKGFKALLATKNIDKWSKTKINSYLEAYKSKEEIQKQWNRYLKFVEFYNQYFPENIFKNKCKSIRSRILFTHGDMVFTHSFIHWALFKIQNNWKSERGQLHL